MSLTVTTAAGYGNVAAMAPPAAMLSSVSSTLYDAMPTAAPCTLTFVSSPVLPAINASYTLTCGSQVYAGVLFLGNTYTYVYPNPISGNGGVGSSFFINQYVLFLRTVRGWRCSVNVAACAAQGQSVVG
jgi:hypothetical protein